jgi:hypothetical protein
MNKRPVSFYLSYAAINLSMKDNDKIDAKTNDATSMQSNVNILTEI